MALAEHPYRILAKNAQEMGMEDLAKEYLEKAGLEAEKIAKEWEERKKRIKEILTDIVNKIMRNLGEILEKEKKQEAIGSPPIINITQKETDFDKELIKNLENILGADKERELVEDINVGVEDKVVILKKIPTELERVILEKRFDNRGRLIDMDVVIADKDLWDFFRGTLNKIREEK